jgi:hypothetical protein
MSDALLFEQLYRGDVWRLEVTSYDGRTFGNWRKWYWKGDTLKPTREGCTIPLERLLDLEAALSRWRAAEAPKPPPSGS